MRNSEKREYIMLQLKLSRVLRSRGQREVTINSIIAQVQKISGVDITRKSRAHEVIIPRQVAHYIAAHVFRRRISLGEIGHIIGGKDHGTVINSRRQVQKYIDTNDYIIRQYLPLLKKYNLL